MEAIRGNALEQYLALRRYYLPHETDDEESIARALWLDEYFAQTKARKTADGIALALNGK
ncbi:DUF6890 family protein [Kluyvera intermedia]|uniref:Uncharacterized protein n=1 Tax=Kluyvera intermedia TaxID=61648 RepID=A0AA95G1U7_KLUIN|nr:hypothetical protein [Kluyvera intermedia]ECN0101381.1 hypothetical protein [Salmonella enterica subsp. enterica serovar Give]WGL57670.1 hypothetical protein QBD33_07825 [Kluyvera intermedia]